VINVTLTDNYADSGGGFYCEWDSEPTLYNTIIAFNTGGGAAACQYYSYPVLVCCDVYGNVGGDWVDCIAGQYGIDGNFSEDPLFCGPLNPDEPFALRADSPCAPDNNPICDLVGACDVGCAASPVEGASWGRIKAMCR
jgi:hypothetical protein